MIEKVNPSHPDKVADRIAGAVVDLAYKTEAAPKIAVEVLIGHGKCHVIIETTAAINPSDVEDAIHRIAGAVWADIDIVPQDKHLSDNQSAGIRCGDNGIFKGVPLTEEQKAALVKKLYDTHKRQIDPVYRVDPAIMGGLIIETEDKIYDGSVKASLRSVKEVMNG